MNKLIALGITTVALAAVPAAQATDDKPPVDANGKKGCAYAKFDGSTGYYPHGTTITVTLPSGGSKTVKCNDGEWESAKRAIRPTLRITATDLYVTSSEKLVMKNQHRVTARA